MSRKKTVADMHHLIEAVDPIVRDVLAEEERARAKFGEDSAGGDNLTEPDRAAVIGEEYGEYLQLVNDARLGKISGLVFVVSSYDELVQLAASALAVARRTRGRWPSSYEQFGPSTSERMNGAPVVAEKHRHRFTPANLTGGQDTTSLDRPGGNLPNADEIASVYRDAYDAVVDERYSMSAYDRAVHPLSGREEATRAGWAAVAAMLSTALDAPMSTAQVRLIAEEAWSDVRPSDPQDPMRAREFEIKIDGVLTYARSKQT